MQMYIVVVNYLWVCMKEDNSGPKKSNKGDNSREIIQWRLLLCATMYPLLLDSHY